jgi:putative CocE/NonD family hydrolase
MWLSDGDRKTYTAGRFLRRDATDWPVPGTRWRTLALDAERSGTATSLNDGSLAADASPVATKQSYPSLPSIPTMTDVPNAAILDAGGLAALTDNVALLSDMRLAEPLGLTFTSAPLRRDLLSVGPGALDVTLSSTAPTGTIWAVVSDVGPDGVGHPLTVGRLSTDFPGVDESRSLKDPRTGAVVQPYGRYDESRPASPGVARRYQVELWPLGNRFRRGHRVRLQLVGTSAASPLAQPGLNTVTLGGPDPSRLLLPVVPTKKKGHR